MPSCPDARTSFACGSTTAACAYRANGGEKQKTIDELVAVRDAAAAALEKAAAERAARAARAAVTSETAGGAVWWWA